LSEEQRIPGEEESAQITSTQDYSEKAGKGNRKTDTHWDVFPRRQLCDLSTTSLYRWPSAFLVECQGRQTPFLTGGLLRYETESHVFDLPGRTPVIENYQFVPNEELKIKSISRPYIEQFNYD
jgi:hypothetical protein